MAPGAQHAALDHRADARPPLQIGDHGRADHGPHLVRHAGHRVDHLLADRADQAGRRAGHLRDRHGTVRDVRLTQVVGRHLPAARGEQRADPLGHLGAADQGHAHHLGDRLAGDVVLGRPEPAAQDHRVAALQREADAGDDAREIVADLGLEVRIDAGERQLLADPGRVAVDDLAEQQLGADGDDLAAHEPALSASSCPAFRPRAGDRGVARLVPVAQVPISKASRPG